MLTKQQKQKIIKDLSHELGLAKGIVFTSFHGLATKDLQELRGLLGKDGIKHKVVKITLAKRALRQLGFDPEGLVANVPLSVSWSADEVAAAKVLSGFARSHENLKIISGIMDNKFLNAPMVIELAQLPGKLELRGQLVRALAAPIQGLVNVLAGNLRGLVNVLNAIQKAKI